MSECVIPVSDEVLERVRTGKPLRDVGRIDLREGSDALSVSEIARARQEHRLTHRCGHEAPILLREPQMRSLALQFGHTEDKDGNIIERGSKDKILNLTDPGSRFMDHELWVDPADSCA